MQKYENYRCTAHLVLKYLKKIITVRQKTGGNSGKVEPRCGDRV